MRIRLTALSLIILSLIAFGCASGGGGDDSGSSSGNDSGGGGGGAIATLSAFCANDEPDSGTLAGLASGFSEFLASTAFQRKFRASVSRDTTTTIKTVFHVISKGPSLEDGEVPDSQIIAQVDYLNSVFAGGPGGVGTPFRFSLAGINRVTKPEWHVMSPGSDSELKAKQELHQGDATTLNFYLVTTEGGILGYTTLPVLVPLLADFDGIVLNFRTLPGGSQERYNTGNVAVHEAGHWLGLLHTFSGACDAIFGDLVQDTPVELIPQKGEFCPVSRDSCPDVEGPDPVHNHMTYTVDSCRTDFTSGQVDFMLFNAFAFRGLPVL